MIYSSSTVVHYIHSSSLPPSLSSSTPPPPLLQVTGMQERLTKAEQVCTYMDSVVSLEMSIVTSAIHQDKEQLAVDLQLLRVKYEKEQKVQHDSVL